MALPSTPAFRACQASISATGRRLWTVSEVAERGFASRDKVRRAIERGDLPATMIGRVFTVADADLETWLASVGRRKGERDAA